MDHDLIVYLWRFPYHSRCSSLCFHWFLAFKYSWIYCSNHHSCIAVSFYCLYFLQFLLNGIDYHHLSLYFFCPDFTTSISYERRFVIIYSDNCFLLFTYNFLLNYPHLIYTLLTIVLHSIFTLIALENI